MTNILLIGAINENHKPLGGEEYKNQLILKKIKCTPHIQFEYVDTYRWKYKPIIIWSLFAKVFSGRFDTILISASSVSTYRFLQLVGFLRMNQLVKVTYLVIGGYFPEGIKLKRFNWKYYNSLKSIIVEGAILKNTLEINSGLTNVKVLPNFKEFQEVVLPRSNSDNDLFKFVFVGRISESKGVQLILDAVQILNKQDIQVDFYGPQEDEFDFNHPQVFYKGYLDFISKPHESYDILKEYDCMLFPTFWKGEGFPGVIIDAFVAGLPVIASDWNMNAEVVVDGENGFVIKANCVDALVDKMKYALMNKNQLIEIGKNNQLKAKNYHIDRIWPQLLNLL